MFPSTFGKLLEMEIVMSVIGKDDRIVTLAQHCFHSVHVIQNFHTKIFQGVH